MSPRPVRRLGAALLLLAAAAPAVLRAEPTDTIKPRLLGEHGRGRLWQVGEQKVLLVAGTPYEMGLQHGKLLAREARECARMFLDEFAIAKLGQTRQTFADIWKQAEPNIPQKYKDELRGIAEGSGVPIEELQLLHAIPERFHCSGAAAFGPATRDGKLYHTRSLDYSLEIGKDKTAQENSVVVVYKPDDGYAHVNVAWAGFAGSVTGMNAQGVAVGEMGCRHKAETYDGLPMVFLVREILYGADGLERAIEITRRAPRTCGYNFIYSDGKAPGAAAAIEVNKDHVKVFPAGGEEENVAPHYAIPHCVRRVNHFVDKELAAGQRDGYDPRFSAAASWLGYHLISEQLKKDRGKIDAERMIALQRGYPGVAPCLHQAVFAPTDREIYVAFAKNPRRVKLAGAQNQTFYRYRLDRVLAGDPGEVEMYAPPSAAAPAPAKDPGARSDAGPARRRGTLTVAPRPRPAPGDPLAPHLARFIPPDGTFEWELSAPPDGAKPAYDRLRLTFPSAVRSPHEVNNTVIGDYFRPKGAAGRGPAVIVLDILDGRNIAATIVCDHLAKQGIAALTIRQAYFGERRPPEPEFRRRMLSDPALIMASVAQSVSDVGRAREWLRSRPEVDPERVGLCGVSMGGFVAGLAAGVYGDFPRTVLILSAGDVAEVIWNSRGERAVELWLRNSGLDRDALRTLCEPFDPITYASRVPAGSVLMLSADADTVVPAEQAKRFAQALAGCEHVWYAANHYTFAVHAFGALQRTGDHLSAGPTIASRRAAPGRMVGTGAPAMGGGGGGTP
jgi:dienelactone hydrolase/predicted choloylglycine hydrolase